MQTNQETNLVLLCRAYAYTVHVQRNFNPNSVVACFSQKLKSPGLNHSNQTLTDNVFEQKTAIESMDKHPEGPESILTPQDYKYHLYALSSYHQSILDHAPPLQQIPLLDLHVKRTQTLNKAKSDPAILPEFIDTCHTDSLQF